MGGHGQSDEKVGVKGWIIRIIQYLIGTFVSSLAFFYEFNGVFNNYAHVTVTNGWHPGLVFGILVILITILAYCEATQVALMILEKVDSADLGDGWLMGYAKRAHALAKANVNNYLIGRQIFVTCIVMMTAELIHLDHSYITYCREELGEVFGSEVLVSIFVRSGLCGSLILLACGQLIPELTVTTNPTFMFRLPPAYEIIWLNLWCERLGICQFSEILASVTRWCLSLPEDDMFRAGNDLKIGAAGDDNKMAKDDPDSEEYKLRNSYFPTLFRNPIPKWWLGIKYVVGTAIMTASTFGMFFYVLTGGSPWCPTAVPHCGGHELANSVAQDDWDWAAAKAGDGKGPTCGAGEELEWHNTGEWYVGTTTYPDFHYKDMVSKEKEWNTWDTAYNHCIVPQWALLGFLVPIMSVLLMYLEGSQIAVLALEKAPGRQVKRLHRPAYFGHKVSQVRDNVRRYLLGRQFLVVFGDFVAAKCYGMYGIGYIVIIEVYPRLVALKNPMYWLGTWGSRFVLLLAIAIEFMGFTHFAWGLYKILDLFIHKCCGVEDDSFSVGAEVQVGDEKNEDSLLGESPDTLIDIIHELRGRLAKLEGGDEAQAKQPEAETNKPEAGVIELEPKKTDEASPQKAGDA